MSYDPTIGRWTAEDPLAFEGGDVNLYRYVGNSPANATDPTGMAEWAGGSWNPLNLSFWPDSGKTNPSWWDLYPGNLNPFSSPQPSVDWGDTGLKVGKGAAAGTAIVCTVAAAGVAAAGGAAIEVTATGLLKGGEICLRFPKTPPFFRLNPGGHYHRRPIGRPPGPGEGIGRHRPWDPPAPGRPWWTRF